MTKAIFIHGNGGGTGSDAWYPWCVSELKKYNIRALAPDFPDPLLARAQYWLPFLENELKSDENTVLVGHSSGALAAMRFAESRKIKGSILIGASHTDLGDEDEKKSGYFDSPWDWTAIRENQQWIIQFASTDDPYIPITEAHFIRDHLKTEYREFGDRGHFGQTEFPELLQALLTKIENL